MKSRFTSSKNSLRLSTIRLPLSARLLLLLSLTLVHGQSSRTPTARASATRPSTRDTPSPGLRRLLLLLTLLPPQPPMQPLPQPPLDRGCGVHVEREVERERERESEECREARKINAGEEGDERLYQ